jgi:hypothetical protein
MVVNSRARGISRGARKLARTFTSNKKKEANGAFVCSSIVEDDICFVLADD